MWFDLRKFEVYLTRNYPLLDIELSQMGNNIELVSINIKPNYRGLGYGREVMEEVIHFCEEHKVNTLHLCSVQTAYGFYTKLGFTRVSKHGNKFIMKFNGEGNA